MNNSLTRIDKNKYELISDQLFYDFLEMYKITGNMSKALEDLDLTITQIFSKKDSDENLSLEFRITDKKIEESKSFLAKKKLRDLMMQNINNGYLTSETYKKKIFKNPDGEVLKVCEERNITKNPLPIMYYQEFMGNTEIEDAVRVLAENDLLPNEVCKKIMQYEQQLTRSIKESFSLNKAEDDADMSEQQIIDILKEAISDK